MLTITDGVSLARALKLSIDLRFRRLLIERRDQLGGDIEGLARFLIAEDVDDLATLETALGFPISFDLEGSFGCEWVADHGTFYEAVWILTDDGFAHVAFITKHAETDTDLLNLCEMYVTDQV